jgi:hypothetical protein
LRHIDDLLALVHRARAEQGIGILFGKAALVHQDRLGAVDQLAVGQRRARFLQLGLHAREGVEPPHRQFEHGLDPLLAQAIDDIGRNPRIDGRADHRLVRLVDEHRDGPGQRTADGEHFLKRVAAGAAQIHEHDIGCHAFEPGDKGAARGHDVNVIVPGLAQAFFQNCRTQPAVVDDDYAHEGPFAGHPCRNVHMASTPGAAWHGGRRQSAPEPQILNRSSARNVRGWPGKCPLCALKPEAA